VERNPFFLERIESHCDSPPEMVGPPGAAVVFHGIDRRAWGRRPFRVCCRRASRLQLTCHGVRRGAAGVRVAGARSLCYACPRKDAHLSREPIPMTNIPAEADEQAAKTAYAVLAAISACHLLNDMMQSLLPAV